MNYAIILAGGVGSRFWPLSRQTEPKQFLSVCSDKPLIEETIERIAPAVKKENIYIAGNTIHRKKIRGSIRKYGVPVKNVLFEPEGRNTFPPVIFLSHKISKLDPEAVISVLPCDHVIQNNKKFLRLLTKAFLVSNKGGIVTFGVTPKRPETGYGYIKICAGEKERNSAGVYKIEKFIEKPDLETAKSLIKDKKYYWNSGIFVFRADVLIKEAQELLPDVYRNLINEPNFKRLWASLPATSIDYAIMEKAKNIMLVPADYGWLDLGSWQAIEEVMTKDKNGNIFKGNCVDIESEDTFVWSQSRLVASVGLKDIIIVDTDDALLVCSKKKVQEVKKVVQALKKNNSRGQI